MSPAVKNLIDLVLMIPFAAAADNNPQKAKLLADGFVLAGVDGKLSSADNDQKWFFELASDALDEFGGSIKAGTKLELLPSAMLEKIIADMKNRAVADYRLWGRVTKYRSRNFIFPIYFLPLAASEQLPQPQQNIPQTPINEPNDQLIIPQEIVDKLSTHKVVRFEQKEGLELKTDYILADRTAVLVKQPDDSFVFAFDSIGRNICKDSIKLLPCEILQQAQNKQAASPNTIRFKISGIVTRYKNENLLLLQRATPAYGYGNFDR